MKYVLQIKKIYNLRGKNDTIDSFPLICGSIMGKKIAEGIEGLVLDIKTGNGAFMKTKKDALALGSFLQKIGAEYNIKVQYALTNMNQPLGNYSGLLCEIIEGMETLKGNGPKDLLEIIYYLGDMSLKIAGIENSKEKIEKAISSGSAYEIFCKMVYAHGGLLKQIQHKPKEIEFVKAKKEGYINSINTKQLGLSVNALSFDKKGNNKIIDNHAGFKILKKNGAYVKENDIIAKIFCSNKRKLIIEKSFFENSFNIKDEQLNSDKLIFN